MARLKKEDAEVLEELSGQDKMPVIIPIDTLNSDEPYVVVLNGVIYSIPRGTMQYIPKDVFAIVQESLEKNMNLKVKSGIKEI